MFFTDVLSILPIEIDLYIQSPDLEDSYLLEMIKDSDFSYYKLIHLNSQNRSRFIEELKNNCIVEYIQSIEIKKDLELLFEGYDGIESGQFSKKVSIPTWFKEKYKENWNYSISTEW